MRAEQEGLGNEEDWVARMSGQDGFEEGRGRRRVGGSEDERGAMAPDLPSGVARGYERTGGEEGGAVKRRGGFVTKTDSLESRPTAYAPFVGPGQEANGSALHDIRSTGPEHPVKQSTTVESQSTKEPRLSAVQPMNREGKPRPESWTDRTYQRTREKNGIMLPPAEATPKATSVASLAKKQAVHHGRTDRAEDLERLGASQALSSDRTSQAINQFFLEIASAPITDKPSADQIKLSDYCLERSIHDGPLIDIRSICLWKLSKQSMTSDNFRLLTRSMATLADRLPQDQLLALYLDLFRNDEFRALKGPFKYKTKALFLADAATRFERPEMLHLTISLMRPETRSAPWHAIRDRIRSVVQSLLLEDDSAKAGRLLLLLHAASESVLPSSEWDHLCDVASRIIDSCLLKGEIALATRTLQRFYYRISASDPTTADRLLNQVVKVCGERKAYPAVKRMLLYMYGRKQEPWELAATLDDQCKVIIATAFSSSTDKTRHRVVFETLYRLLPQDDRQALMESTSIKTIKVKWRSTRNLNAAESESSSLRQWLIENNDRASLRRLDRAMLEIYLSAGKVQLALDRLAHVRGTGLNSETVSLAVLILAKNGAWDDLRNLQNFAKEKKLLKWDFETIGIWDRIIHLHSLTHTPGESQTFVRDLVTRLGFRPGRAAANTILRSCVEHRSLDLIPGWIKYVKSLGSDFELDSDVAARMFTAFWTHGRPGRRVKHKSIMWHCYFLQRCIPRFDLQSFKDLLKESIGYDLRSRFEQNLSPKNPRRDAVERLQHVEEAVDELPTPDQNVQQGKSGFVETPADGTAGNGDAAAYAGSPGRPPLDASDSGFQQTVQYSPLVDELRDERGLDQRAERQVTVGYHDSTHSLQADPLDALEGASRTDRQMASRDRADNSNAADKSKLDNHRFGSQLPSDIPIMENSDDREYYDVAKIRQADGMEDVHLDRFQEATSADAHDGEDIAAGDRDQIQPLNRQEDGLLGFEWFLDGEEEDSSSLDNLVSVDKSQQNALERKMVMAMSTRDYQNVLDLYHSSLDRRGIPATPRSLEIALQASLRLRDDDAYEAEQIVGRAREAGMDVSCAIGPLIMHRMRSMKSMHRGDANTLRMMVLDYYRSNDTNGRPVSHHIATTAAHQLITNDAPEHGLNLLTAIFNSEWAVQRPLETATMTLFLHGYIQIRSLEGVQWVVQHMLTNDLWISRRFMRELKQTFTPPLDPYWASRFAPWPAPQETRLREWTEMCYRRRIEQIGQDIKMGVRLRWLIKKCVWEQGWEVNVDYAGARREVEAAELGPEDVDLEWLRPKGRLSAKGDDGDGIVSVPAKEMCQEHGSNVMVVEVARG